MELVFSVPKTKGEIIDVLDRRNICDMMDYRFSKARPDEIKIVGFRTSYGEYIQGGGHHSPGGYGYAGICWLSYEQKGDGSTRLHVRTHRIFADRLSLFLAWKLGARPQIVGGVGAPP